MLDTLSINPSRATLVYLHDLGMTAVAFILALYLRVGSDTCPQYSFTLAVLLPLLLGVAAITYRLSGLYRGIWRYASTPDMEHLILAVTVTVLVFGGASLAAGGLGLVEEPLPRSVPAILWLVLLALLGGPRFGYRQFKDHRLIRRSDPAGIPQIPVLLIGMGDAAALFIRSLTEDIRAAYRVVGVLDEKGGQRVGRSIRGVPILGGARDLTGVVGQLALRGLRPQRLILTKSQPEMPELPFSALLEEADTLGLPLARLPSLTEFKAALDTGKLELRPVAIEDLLGRPQATLDRRAIRKLVRDRRVLITGAGGSIGSELCRQVASLAPSKLILVENGEFNLYTIDQELRDTYPKLRLEAVLGDVRNRERMEQLFTAHHPELVFHAAALKHVPLVEAHPSEGVLTNVIGTRNVADAARAVGTHIMVLISTDKAVKPGSVLGASKRVAESYCQALDTLALKAEPDVAATRFVTVRFGNVLGSSGSVVPLFQRQLARGGPLTVTHPDMRRYFMTVREAVELVLQASAHGAAHPDERGRVLVLDMGEPVRIADMARQIIRLSGLKPDVDVKVVYSGIRPGEKLFEEILSPEEAPSRTEADGVFLASPPVMDQVLLAPQLQALESAAHANDAQRVREILHLLVGSTTFPL